MQNLQYDFDTAGLAELVEEALYEIDGNREDFLIGPVGNPMGVYEAYIEDILLLPQDPDMVLDAIAGALGVDVTGLQRTEAGHLVATVQRDITDEVGQELRSFGIPGDLHFGYHGERNWGLFYRVRAHALDQYSEPLV